MKSAEHGMLAVLPPGYRDQLLGCAYEADVPAGDRIFDEGEAADRFWIVRSGLVALDLYLPGRGPAVLETLGPGDLLGWSWLFAPFHWHLGARAREDVTAYEFDAAAVRRAIDADPGFGLAVTRCVATAIGQRLRACRARLLDMYATPASAPETGGGGRP